MSNSINKFNCLSDKSSTLLNTPQQITSRMQIHPSYRKDVFRYWDVGSVYLLRCFDAAAIEYVTFFFSLANRQNCPRRSKATHHQVCACFVCASYMFHSIKWYIIVALWRCVTNDLLCVFWFLFFWSWLNWIRNNKKYQHCQ